MTLRQQLVCVLLVSATAGCSSSTPTTPGGGVVPTPAALSVTYSGQIRIDSCAGCTVIGGVTATRPYVLRLSEVAAGRVEGTVDFGYHENYWGPLTLVSGSRMTDGSFRLSGSRQPLSAFDHTNPVELTSLIVTELPGGSLAGTAEFTVAAAQSRSGAYRATLVSGTQSVGSAAVGIDGRWLGRTEVLACSGDLCQRFSDVPGRVQAVAFTFVTQAAQLQGIAGSDNYFFLPGVRAALPLQGTFAGQKLTAGVDTEVIEFSESDHVPPNTEFARLRVTMTNVSASIDAYNRLQGDITYTVVRTVTYRNSALLGQVLRGTYTVRLYDVVPKPL